MATGLGRSRICLVSFNSPTTEYIFGVYAAYIFCGPTPKITVIRKDLGDISGRFMADFVQNFVAMATGCFAVKFVCCLSIARPQKAPVIRKDLGDISYIGRVIADFVQNFVAMATGFSAVEFGWRHSIARPRKPLLYAKILGISPSYSRFCPTFRCHGNRGHLG